MKYILLASIAGNFANRLKSICIQNTVDFKATFITTAANIYAEKQWMEDDINLFVEAGFTIKRVDLDSLSQEAIEEELKSTQICIMGGGNPIYLLEVLRRKEIIHLFKNKISEGMMYVGSSAGAVIASSNIELERIFEDRKDVRPLDSYAALDLVNFQVLPHWGNASFEKEYMKMLREAYTRNETVISLSDDQALEIIDDKMKLLTQSTC